MIGTLWLRELLRDLLAERGRIAMVASGVVWGTLSLTLLLGFDDAMHGAMDEAMEVTGRRLVIVRSGATTRPFRGLPAGRRIALTPADAAAVAASVPGIDGYSCEHGYSGIPIQHGDRRLNVRVHGVDPSYRDLRSYEPEPGGRFIHERDMDERRRVAFLGSAVAQRLFGDESAIGRRVRIWDVPFTVVGVLQFRTTLGNYNGVDEDRVVIPASTFRTTFGERHLSHLVLRLAHPERERETLAAVYSVLGRRLGFDPDDRAALSLNNRLAALREVDGILLGSRVFTTIVGVLSLLVAALGVANMMYAMVEERVREIGIAMAVGATRRSVALRHLAEALVVVLLGGLVGLVLSALLLWGFNQLPLGDRARAYLGTPEVSVVTAFLVALALGVAGALAGYYPARRAASVDPIEVLREE